LITLGLYPYRTLARLQLRPHELHYNGTVFIFYHFGKALFKIPEESIEEALFFQKNGLYGLSLTFRSSLKEKVVILQPSSSFKVKGKRELFLPYFSLTTVERIKVLLAQDHAS